MRFTWRGHACYEIETLDGRTILVDPFLEGSRLPRPSPDLVLLTHGHADHTGSIASFPDIPVVCIADMVSWLAVRGMRRVTGMNVGGFHAPWPGTRLWMAPAVHSSGIEDAPHDDGTLGYGGSPCGFVLDDGDTRAYVAGDTAIFGDMRAVIRDLLQPHVAILPIGDHFTMGPQHAGLAAQWLGVNVAVPYHYGTFPVIEQDPREFEKAVGTHARVVIPGVDGSFEVRQGRLVEK